MSNIDYKKPLYEVDYISNLREMLVNSTKKFGSKPAFYKKDAINTPYNSVSYDEYAKDVRAFTEALYEKGLQGKRIAIIGENRYEWSVSYMSVVCGLGVIVPLDKDLPTNEIILSLNRAECEAIICSKKFSENVIAARDDIPTLKMVIGMNEGWQEDFDKFVNFHTLLNRGHELLKCTSMPKFDELPIDADAMSILLFTSGTTSSSKAVMLSHSNICKNMMAMCSMTYIDDKDIFLSILPIHHTYECTCGFLCPLYRGASVAYCDGLRYISKNMAEAHVTMILCVPLLVEAMYKKVMDGIAKNKQTGRVRFAIFVSNVLRKIGIDLRPKLFKSIKDGFGGSLRMFVVGAAKVDGKVSKNLNSFGFDVIQGYGLTECAPIAALNRDCLCRFDSAGLPMPGVDIQIADKDSDGIGEIMIKGPNVMLGYYGDEAATREAINSDGYFHSGDFGYINKRGFVFITGRKKSVIVTKNGKNIFPEEIEELLLKSPYIKEVLVYGEPDRNDTMVKANIFPNFDKIKEDFAKQLIETDDANVIFESEIKKLNKGLVHYKAIKSFHIRDHEFVKTSTNKIKRYVEENKQ